MNVFVFHLMPWDRLSADFEQRFDSAWTSLPNTLYDPRHGHQLYNRYLDELVLAEELGFDGVGVTEHHQNAYGTTPSPNLLAAILARQTRRVRIAVLGNTLPLHDPPTRIAEEFAMIDVISGGRLIAGLSVGGGPEYHSYAINPTFAHSMYHEALDLVLRAWREPGPFAHHGQHWRLKYVNPWPRPLQQPHPPIWVPGNGSKESIEFVAQRRYNYLAIPYFHIDFFQQNADRFRQHCQKNGYEAAADQLGWLLPIYVADSDAQAWADYEAHLWYFAHKLLKGMVVFPPGYASPRSLAGINRALANFLSSVKTRAEIEAGGYAIVGSPATVRDRLLEYLPRLGVGNLLGLFQLGTLPAELTQQNMTLFAEQVMPQLRSSLDATE